MTRAMLPARPLGLRAGVHVKTALLVAFMLACTAGLGLATTWFVSSGGSIGRDKAIWTHGLRADGEIKAERTSKLVPWILASYHGTVRYTDAEGASYEGTIGFWTMLGGPDTDNAELRYDPQHHDQFAVSWGVEASGARWRAVIVMSLLFALLTLASGFGTWAIIDNALVEARVARAGDEVQLRVVACSPVVKEGKPTGKHRHELELDLGDGRTKRIVKDAPWLLRCGPNDSHVLGLWIAGKPHSLIVIGSDLHPLAVTRAERAEITSRISARAD